MNRMAPLIGLCLALGFPGCGPGAVREEESGFGREIRTNPEPAPESFPLAPLELPRELAQTIASARVLEDVFPLAHYIRLEAAEGAYLKEMTSVAVVHGSVFVVDFPDRKVVQFDRDGRFLRRVGGFGQGPGELQQPIAVRTAYAGHVAVADRGKIAVYDIHGRHVFSTTARSPQAPIGSSSRFIWPRRERLYLGDFSAFDQRTPRHVLLHFDAAGRFEVGFGFGERHQGLHQYGVKYGRGRAFPVFTLIDGRIWTVAPEACRVLVYDTECRHLGGFTPPHPNAISHEDFEDLELTPEKVSAVYSQKGQIHLILQVGPLAVIEFWSRQMLDSIRFDLYDAHGNILANALPPLSANGLFLLASEDDLLYGQKHATRLLEEENTRARLLTDADLAALAQAGWRPGQEDEATYLWVGRLAGQSAD